MVAQKENKAIKNLNEGTDLKKALVPSIKTLPLGSINTKIIISEGKVIERLYETPNGEIISILPNPKTEKVD